MNEKKKKLWRSRKCNEKNKTVKNKKRNYNEEENREIWNVNELKDWKKFET